METHPSFAAPQGPGLRPFLDEDAEALWRMSQEASYLRHLPDQVYADPAEALAALRWLRGHHEANGAFRALPWVLGVTLGEGGR
jgi:hypothetical protein